MRLNSLTMPLLALALYFPGVAISDTPTTDQRGMFSGKGKMTYCWVDEAKSAKVSGEFVLMVNADGSGSLTTPDYPGGSYTFDTMGNYGTYRGTFIATGSGTERGRLEIKSKGAKTSIKVYGRYASTDSEVCIEYTASLKKLPPI